MPPERAAAPVAEVSVEDLAGPDAAAVLHRLRQTAPVAWVPALAGWLVTGHAAAGTVLRDAATFTVDDPRFSTARVVGASMLSTDGERHRRHRAPFAPPFRAAQVHSRYGATTERLARELVTAVRGDGRADLRTALAGPLSASVIAAALGLDVDVPTVLGWYRAIVAAVTEITAGGETGGTDSAAGVAGAVDDLGAALRAGLRATQPSVLTGATEALPDHEVVANAAVMMFGGIETTEGMIANLLLHLLRRPEALARVLRAPEALDAAVEESLRLEPAAAVVDRYATTEATVAGTAIGAGELVRVSLAGANRDPAVFADPDAFDPARPNLRQQLAFARGPHACLAMDLARLETRAAVGAALELPGLRLTGDAPVTGLVFRKPSAVPTAWEAPPRT